MPGIVCAIRGGPDSQPTIGKAISLAFEKELKLNFLYVVNFDFLNLTERGRTHFIYDEMDQMGEFILLMAQEQANTKKVEADGVVRHGQVGEEIIKLAQEIMADFVVLGQPQAVEENNVFDNGVISGLGTQIEAETSAKVIFAEWSDE